MKTTLTQRLAAQGLANAFLASENEGNRNKLVVFANDWRQEPGNKQELTDRQWKKVLILAKDKILAARSSKNNEREK